jgi:hypothetical protein
MPCAAPSSEIPRSAASFLSSPAFGKRNRQYVGLIYAAHFHKQDNGEQQRECAQAGSMTMLQSFLLTKGLEADDVEMLAILSAAFMPSIVGLLLAFFALWLPEDGKVASPRRDDLQRGHHRTDDRGPDWHRAA